MFKIGEFSKLTQVSVRMLRYYDENDLLKPAYIDACSGLSLREKVNDYYEENKLWKKLCDYVNEHKIETVQGPYNNLSIYHDEDSKEEQVDIEIGVVVPKVLEVAAPFYSYETKAYEQAAYMMVYGPYSRMAKAYEQLAYWLNEHKQYEMYGSFRQVSHIGPGEVDSPADYLTEIQIPVRKR